MKPAGAAHYLSLVSMFRRSAADVAMTLVAHGLRRGLQIFRRSAADVAMTLCTHGLRRGLQIFRRSAADVLATLPINRWAIVRCGYLLGKAPAAQFPRARKRSMSAGASCFE